MLQDRSKYSIAGILVAAFLGYSCFLYADLPIQNKEPVQAADKGKMLWQQYNCGACHQVYGLGGYLGPDLTNSYSKRGPAYIRAFLQNGTNIMPNYHLTETEITELTNYLRHLDASGNSDPRTFTIQRNGFINQ